jgi:hypothetical protein
MEETRMNNKILKSARMFAASGLLLVLGMAAPAQADDIICETLEGLNKAMPFLILSHKDGLGLQGKLDMADAKIEEGKTCDASFKVADFNAKIEQLVGARKTKIGETYYGAIECAQTGSAALAKSLNDDAGGNCERKTKGPKNK